MYFQTAYLRLDTEFYYLVMERLGKSLMKTFEIHMFTNEVVDVHTVATTVGGAGAGAGAGVGVGAGAGAGVRAGDTVRVQRSKYTQAFFAKVIQQVTHT